MRDASESDTLQQENQVGAGRPRCQRAKAAFSFL
jgi:hypothetical protein